MPNASQSPPSGGDVSYDKLFKTVFERFFRDLIELVEPKVAAVLDLDQAKFFPPELYADFRKAGTVEPDLVAEVSTRDGEPRLVVVHVDIEGAFRRTIDERLWRYAMHLRIDHKKPVISLAVFLRGGAPGMTVRELTETVGPFETNRFRYLAFGLSGSLAEEYIHRPQPLAAALAAVMRSEIWDRVEQKVECLRAISRREELDLDKRYVLARVVNTFIRLDEDEEKLFAVQLQRQDNEEVREMVVTWEEALAESRAQGEARGEARGQVVAARTADLRAAQHRFGSLPTAFEERIRALDDLHRLYEILDQILEAESLEDIDLD